MELKHIKELMSAMGRTGLKRLSIEKDNFKLELERGPEEMVKIIEPSGEYVEEQLVGGKTLLRRADLAFSKGGHATTIPPAPAKGKQPHDEASSDKEASGKEQESSNLKYVKSPMVGTFYQAPSPDHPPYVKVGDTIEEDTVVCIIEAMKVMNEIKAGVSGVVKEITVENGHPVEFGTALIKVE